MKLSSNFSLAEFASKCGSKTPENVIKNLQQLATQLQALRDEIGVAIVINSGYRSPKHNKRVGGSPKSQHMQGKAADITARGFTPRKLADVIERLIREGKMQNGGLGVYPTFVHYDIGGAGRRW